MKIGKVHKFVNLLAWREMPYNIFMSLIRKWYTKIYIKKYLPGNKYYKEYPLIPKKDLSMNNTVWVYWNKGEENAPVLVKQCIQSIRAFANSNVVVLNSVNVSNYIDLPSYIKELHDKGKIKEAFFSDLIRLNLLIMYGGIWMDATCYMTAPFPKYIEDASFFVFQSDLLNKETPIYCSSWFIKSDSDNMLLTKLRNVLYSYLVRNTYLHDYYIFHLGLSALIDFDNSVKSIWENIPYVCNMNPHLLQFSFDKPYSENLLEHITKQSFVHKLTFKFDNKRMTGNTLLEYILKKEK